MKKLSGAFLLSFFLVGSTFAGSNQVTDARIDTLMGSDTHKQYHHFLIQLQQAVAAKDKIKVAAMVDYPVTVTVNHQSLDIADSTTFINEYDKIFTERLNKIILSQKYSDLIAKDTGIMIGEHGELWFSGLCTVKDCSQFSIKIMQITN